MSNPLTDLKFDVNFNYHIKLTLSRCYYCTGKGWSILKIFFSLLLTCATINVWAGPNIFQNKLTDWSEANYFQTIENLEERLDHAESIATPEGLAVLKASRSMISGEEVVVGSCWDFIDAVFDRAGFPSKQRITAHKGSYSGPFADNRTIQPGDWLYFINHSYEEVEHSGIFIGWSDDTYTEALVSSYAGGNKPVPGRYRLYDLSHVFNVIRGK